MLLMSSLPAGISVAFGAGKNLFPGKLFESVQNVEDRTVVDRQERGKVYVESDSQPKGSTDAYQP
jgi:hypothetical protein